MDQNHPIKIIIEKLKKENAIHEDTEKFFAATLQMMCNEESYWPNFSTELKAASTAAAEAAAPAPQGAGLEKMKVFEKLNNFENFGELLVIVGQSNGFKSLEPESFSNEKPVAILNVLIETVDDWLKAYGIKTPVPPKVINDWSQLLKPNME